VEKVESFAAIQPVTTCDGTNGDFVSSHLSYYVRSFVDSDLEGRGPVAGRSTAMLSIDVVQTFSGERRCTSQPSIVTRRKEYRKRKAEAQRSLTVFSWDKKDWGGILVSLPVPAEAFFFSAPRTALDRHLSGFNHGFPPSPGLHTADPEGSHATFAWMIPHFVSIGGASILFLFRVGYGPESLRRKTRHGLKTWHGLYETNLRDSPGQSPTLRRTAILGCA